MLPHCKIGIKSNAKMFNVENEGRVVPCLKQRAWYENGVAAAGGERCVRGVRTAQSRGRVRHSSSYWWDAGRPRRANVTGASLAEHRRSPGVRRLLAAVRPSPAAPAAAGQRGQRDRTAEGGRGGPQRTTPHPRLPRSPRPWTRPRPLTNPICGRGSAEVRKTFQTRAVLVVVIVWWLAIDFGLCSRHDECPVTEWSI